VNVTWRKSSRSGGDPNDSACVEIASTLGQVRDSKNAAGPTLRGDVRALVSAVKAGRLSR
jgi:hypothetical protein